MENKLKNKILSIKKVTEKKVRLKTKTNEVTTPTTSVKAIIDKWSMFKSNVVLNRSLNGWINTISSHLRRYSMFYLLGLVIFMFAINTDGANLKAIQFNNIIQNYAFIFIVTKVESPEFLIFFTLTYILKIISY